MSEPQDALVDDLYDAMETHRAVGVDRVERIAADLRARGWSQGDSLDVERLAEIVSDSLAACTEGTDWAEAPEPSDEPGSPYVLRLTNELAARGVRAAPQADSLREAAEDAIRLLEVVPYSFDVEQAGAQAGIAIETLRAALAKEPE